MRTLSPEVVELEPQQAISLRGEVRLEDLSAFFERAFAATADTAEAAGVEIVGPPFGFYPEMPTATVVVEAGFAVSDRVARHGDVHPLLLPGGRALRVMHIGPYDTLSETYESLQHWTAERGLRLSDRMWECYLSDPVTEPDPATWRTLIVWPLL